MEHSSFEKAKNESRSFTSSLSSPISALTCHLALYTSRWLWMPAPGPLCVSRAIRGTEYKRALVSEYEGRMCLRPCSLHATRARAIVYVKEGCAHDSALENVLMADTEAL
jgi:hypothetical protein